MFKERIYLFFCLPACYRFHLFALALYVNWARFTDEKVSRRFHSPGWATNICTCLYLVVRDRIVLNKAKERYHLSWFYHFFLSFWFCCFFFFLGIVVKQYKYNTILAKSNVSTNIPPGSKNSKKFCRLFYLRTFWDYSHREVERIVLEVYCTGDVLHWVSVSEPWAQIDLTTRLQNQCFVPRDVRRVPNPSHFTGCSELSLLVGKDLF